MTFLINWWRENPTQRRFNFHIEEGQVHIFLYDRGASSNFIIYDLDWHEEKYGSVEEHIKSMCQEMEHEHAMSQLQEPGS